MAVLSKEMRIPTIDFSKVELGEWESVTSQVVKALEEYGCFIAIYDKVSKETREAMFDILKEIFEFPVETKRKNSVPENPSDGYIGQFPHLPLYESFCLSDLTKPQNVETFANIFWPHGNPHFFKVYESYIKPLVELDEMIKRMVLESLKVEDYLGEILDACNFNSRFSYYKEAPQGKDLGLNNHTDSSFLTIIAQNSVNGLEVQTKNGEWIDVNIPPNSFVVFSGNAFMAWTNGRLYSPTHRVTASSGDRFSIPLFSIAKSDYIIKAPKEFVDEEHPLLFKPFDMPGFYKYTASEAGAKKGKGTAEAFKDFCGV